MVTPESIREAKELERKIEKIKEIGIALVLILIDCWIISVTFGLFVKWSGDLPMIVPVILWLIICAPFLVLLPLYFLIAMIAWSREW